VGDYETGTLAISFVALIMCGSSATKEASVKEEIVVLDFGIVERRIYDENGKLVEIRKEYPPQAVNRKRGLVKYKTGTASDPGD